ncbi:protein of unknown function DUF6 transmembrane [Thermodesulfatator indicus DSM 15286]|uniref:EamA domain-containing protein n=1 Tax=Thermodesulfatator indicus (strain DSM 15286 / JCM 11887 / CIR29812) TaxID=667014 RepID=F8A8J7_THEID|nr:EamA family transporter [Thermodesulfatator indicus]AEH45083.1 protein of unknown function DUF6 transmembrane [Thermodesulfatator indicus DSM 15286]
MVGKAILFWFLTIFFWGSAPLLERTALKGMSPLLALALRTSFAAILLVFAVLVSGEHRTLSQLGKKEIIAALASGIVAGVFGMFTYFSLLKTGQASKVVPLTAAYPLVTAILSFMLLGERITLMRFSGIVITIVGLIILLRS